MKLRVPLEAGNTSIEASFRELKAFSEVMHTGSATAAGRQLGVSQSGVSRLIAQLEKIVGFELFYRDKGRLIANADAKRLLIEVDLTLGSMERFQNLARDIAGLSSGKIAVVAPPSFSEAVLADIVEIFLTRHPGVAFSIDSPSPETSLSMISMRYADCGFVKLPIDAPDLTTEVMMANGSVCVMHEEHPLSLEQVVTPTLIGRHPLISLGAGRSWRVQVDQVFAEFNLKPSVVIETHTHGSACALAARGLGVTILNERLACSYLHGPLVTRPFKPDILHEYAFAMSSVSTPSRLTLAFRDVAREFLAQPDRG
jgi:DNA-binding transcriptional LysR family regulator